MRWTATGLRCAATKSVAGGALIVLAATAASAQAFAMPATAGIFGAPVPLEPPGPFGPPTGPDDDSCISQPADPVCGGGPYALPSPPTIPMPSPAVDGGMPGIAGIGGMPGTI
ncbi:hypothetical protein [Mycolicibacterium frederiksbergense]|uniref:hypothetical protein n=1 Tax=Mycolicibacterium frederiksbergense TaxID=117567 RepID=UPI00265BB59C|nr:hypothetical protein [Mycolicibacterium frederiksbergense]MDO0973899.1 hypothetical protein [Mycolicibacterium frederiksbergense]